MILLLKTTSKARLRLQGLKRNIFASVVLLLFGFVADWLSQINNSHFDMFAFYFSSVFTKSTLRVSTNQNRVFVASADEPADDQVGLKGSQLSSHGK